MRPETSLASKLTWIGSAACERRCLQLQLVDLSSTEVTEIMGSAFAHCEHLQCLRLPHKLRRIEQEAFFLHESRRYVCRFCTSHLVRVKMELRYRLQPKRERKSPQNKQNTQQTKHHPSKAREEATCLATRGIVKRGETGVKQGQRIQQCAQ